MKQPPFRDAKVQAVFDGYPTAVRGDLLRLRRLIHATASRTDAAGALVETLKWGQPAYLTERPKTGSTIRLGALKGDGYAMYFHCQTTLVATFRTPSGFKATGRWNFRPATTFPKTNSSTASRWRSPIIQGHVRSSF